MRRAISAGETSFARTPASGLKGSPRLPRLDEERMNSVVETPRAGRGFTQVVNGARSQSGLLQELAARAIGWFLAALDQARRQLPRECFQRRPILPHDRNFPAPGERDNGDIVGLLDGVIELHGTAAGKFHFACD